MIAAKMAGVGRRRVPYLWVEFVAIFVAAPAGFALFQPRGLLIVGMWVLAAGALLLLLTDRSYDRRELVRVRGVKRELRRIGWMFVPLGFGMAVLMNKLMPEAFCYFPRERPVLWAAIMGLYPIFSVLPQSVIWRSFFLHRYRPLVGAGWPAVVAAAMMFGYAHVLFLNPVAPALTFAGGLLFTHTHLRTRSLPIAAIEHAMYGCLAFTLGYGQFLYTGNTG